MTTETGLTPVAPVADLPEPTDIVVALSPSELPAAQAQLVAWCDRQRAMLQTELADLEEHRLIALGNGWKLTSVTNQVRRAEQRLRYYTHVKAALDAGYLLVPNMPVDLLAVRVTRHTPRRGAEKASWNPGSFLTNAGLVPLGEGRYVDERVAAVDERLTVTDEKGHKKQEGLVVSAGAYDEPDFPVRAVKPSVLTRTQEAMALKLFDEIGMVRQDSQAGGRDPIMVGRIRTDYSRAPKVATFFLAWWLDPQAL